MNTKWRKQKISDIATVFDDGNWIESKDQSPKGIWLVQTGNIGVIVFRDKEMKRFVSEDTFKRLDCTEIFAGDILISRLPDPIGRACIIPKTAYRMITAVDCTILRLKKEYEPRYINYLLNAEQTKSQVYQMVTGSSRKRISRKNLATVELSIPTKDGKPDLAEQKQIADKLDKVFSEIAKSVDKIKLNKKYTSKTTYSELLTTFSDEDLKTYSLEEVCDTTSGGTPSRSNSAYYNGDISWLKSGELNDNRSLSSSEEHISEDAITKSNAKVFPSGTVLMAMYGATVGKLGILSASASTNQAVCAITPHKNILNEYMFWYLYFYRDELVKKAFGGAQPNISQTLIRKLPIKVPLKDNQPDLVKQKEIVAKINAIQEKQEKLTDLFSRQEKLFASFRSSVLSQSFQMQT